MSPSFVKQVLRSALLVLAISLLVPALAAADSPSVASVKASIGADGKTITVTGTWTWSAGCGKPAGFNVVWNDPNDLGWPVGPFLVGTQNDNTIHPMGCNTFGPLSHTYTGSLPSQVCAVVYHDKRAGATAGGPNRQTDNSVEENGQTSGPNVCAAIPQVTTDATIGGPFKIGDQIADQATLSGATLNAGGTISYYLFGPDDATCSGGDLSKAIFTSSSPVTGNGTYNSAAFTTTAAGTYRWIANYTPALGDTSNTATANGCNGTKESVVVGQAGPTVTTDASADVTLGGSITDGATLSGGVSPTGSITFDLYGPNDAGCNGPVIFTTSTPVNGNGKYSSAAFKPTAAGTYRWIANYGGDGNNAKTTNGCNAANDENVVVNSPGCQVNCSPVCTVNCTPPAPGISIVKTGPATANAGDAIPYNLDVKNTGPVSFPEANVTLSDALCGATPTLVSKNGDTATPGTLDPGETWSYTCSVPTAAGQTFVHNVGCVTGRTAAGASVSACDDADTVLANSAVEPLLPGVARLRGPTGCIAARTHVLTVSGQRIARVSFYLDGRYIGTRTKPNRGSTFTMTIRGAKLRRGSHVVLAKVTYRPGSNPQSRTLTLAFARCARAVTPKFTG